MQQIALPTRGPVSKTTIVAIKKARPVNGGSVDLGVTSGTESREKNTGGTKRHDTVVINQLISLCEGTVEDAAAKGS